MGRCLDVLCSEKRRDDIKSPRLPRLSFSLHYVSENLSVGKTKGQLPTTAPPPQQQQPFVPISGVTFQPFDHDDEPQPCRIYIASAFCLQSTSAATAGGFATRPFFNAADCSWCWQGQDIDWICTFLVRCLLLDGLASV